MNTGGQEKGQQGQSQGHRHSRAAPELRTAFTPPREQGCAHELLPSAEVTSVFSAEGQPVLEARGGSLYRELQDTHARPAGARPRATCPVQIFTQAPTTQTCPSLVKNLYTTDGFPWTESPMLSPSDILYLRKTGNTSN